MGTKRRIVVSGLDAPVRSMVNECLPSDHFDIDPNPLALAQYGPEFILKHDVCDGVTDKVVELVHEAAPGGATLVYMDPPYLVPFPKRSHDFFRFAY